MLRHGYSTENTKDVTRREEGVGIALGHAVNVSRGTQLTERCTCSHYIATYGEKDTGAE